MTSRRRRSKVTRVVNAIKKLIAFLFSHVGLCILVIGYAMLGAVTFRAVERPFERSIQQMVVDARRRAVTSIWNTTYRWNVLDVDRWKARVTRQMHIFDETLLTAVKKGYDGKELGVNAQWTFSGAFLYSLTVVTTIGYGNIACKTYFGKTITILYAIIGIPLMLLFLTNIGDGFAKTFKFLYSKAQILRVRLAHWHRKRKMSRLRRQNSAISGRSRTSANRYYEKGNHRYKHNHSHESFNQPAPDLDELLSQREQLDEASFQQSVDRLSNVNVPLSLVLLTMMVYLGGGSILFAVWEGWGFLDAFYFCCISLTTIGFGDLFPGASVSDDAQSQEKLIISSFYLLLGMALIAMCFNLAQEEVVSKVAVLAHRFGCIKNEDENDEQEY